MEFPYGGSVAGYDGSAVPILAVSSNAYFVSGVGDKYVITGPASRYLQNQGVHAWYNASSGTAGNAISFSQAMTLDASGNLVIAGTTVRQRFTIGGTTPIATSAPEAIDLGATYSNTAGQNLKLYLYNDGTIKHGIGVSAGSSDYVTAASGIHAFYTGTTERLRLDASGNLGLGVTPSVWNNDYKTIQVGLTACFYGRVASKQVGMGENFYRDAGGVFRYLTTATAQKYELDSGSFYWSTAPSGTAGNAISFTQDMTLTSAGLGIGTSSPSYKLDVLGTSRIYQSGNTAASLMLNANQGTIGTGYAFTLAQTNSSGNYNFTISEGATTYLTLTSSISGAGGNVGIGTSSPSVKLHAYSGTSMGQITADGTGAIKTGINFASGGTTYGQIYFDNNSPYDMSVMQQYSTGSLRFGTNDTERARIDSSGNLLLSTTSTGGYSGFIMGAGKLIISPGTYNNTTATAGNMGVAADGAFYRSTSALKYKQDIRDVEDFDISALRPVRYKSKCDGDDQTKDHLGLIADEAAEAGFEELVTRGANGEVEGFQYERLTVVLLKKLQTQQAIITALTARVAALESI